MCVFTDLWSCTPIFDLTGEEALLIGVLHTGKHTGTAEAHWVDGTLVVEQHPIRNDLGERHEGHTIHAELVPAHEGWDSPLLACEV